MNKVYVKVILRVTVFLTLLFLVTSCATKVKKVEVPAKQSRMQRLIECTRGLIQDDVRPVEAAKMCETFINSRR